MAKLRLFFRLFIRPLAREPLRTALAILAVALGVAVVLAIAMAGDAATGSFLSSVQSLAGKSDFEVTATGGVSGETVARLATLPYPLEVDPRIEDYAVVSPTAELVPLIGVDLIAGAARQPPEIASSPRIQESRCVWVSPGLPAQGGKIELQINDRTESFNVCGLLPAQTAAQGGAVMMDIALASAVLDRGDKVDVALITVPHNGPISMNQWDRILRGALPSGAILKRFGAQARENQRMLGAFRWNLRVLSAIALIVGGFLIYNNLSVSVVRRRAEIGIVRALGGSQWFILIAFLGESLLYGLIGSAAGLALGRVLAAGAVHLISTTVQSLYLTSQPAPVGISDHMILLAFGLGTGVAMVSALIPAYEASQVSPVEAMARGRREYDTRTHQVRLLLVAAVCAGAGYGASRMPAVSGTPLFGYAAALLLLASCALSIPAAVTGFAEASSGTLRRWASAEAHLALRSLVASLRRTSVLLAALATAIAMVVSVGIMVGSFRETVASWLGDDLMADFYVQPAGPVSPDRFPKLSPEIAARISALSEVAAVDPLRAYTISYQGAPTTLAGDVTRIAERHEHVEFLPGEDPHAIFNRLEQPHSVVVSEPFAVKHGIRAGDSIALPLPGGPVTFAVAGIYHDYSDPGGAVLMDRATLLKYLPDPAPSGLAVYLKTGVSNRAAHDALERACAGRKILVISNRALRRQAIQVFDRTFRITYALEAIALFIAIFGVSGALMALVVDRRRELGILRFLGSSARQIRRLILFEAALLGLLGCLIGFILGVVLSLVLIFVINKQSFGWTIEFHWPLAMLATALVIIYSSTVAAGVYPGRLAMNLNPIEVVHEE